MHVTFVSQCEKKALRRTRAILDRYAVRVSDRSWLTPMTLEALNDVRMALRRVATRQTAVACFANKGIREMRLLWVIGNSDTFGANGEIAVGTRRRPKPPPPPWVRVASLIAKAAGLAHDLGKGSLHFQDKLARACDKNSTESGRITKDATRHEWVSMKLYQAMYSTNHFDWESAWLTVRQSPGRHEMPFRQGVSSRALASAHDAVDFAILTHHGLLAPDMAKNSRACPASPTSEAHTRRSGGKGNDDSLFVQAGQLNHQVLQKLAKTTERLQQATLDRAGDLPYWRGLTLLSRASLILADHEVSAINKNKNKDGTTKKYSKKTKEDVLFANTCANEQTNKRENLSGRKKKKFVYNQMLDWHLQQVSERAQFYLHCFATPELPGLTPQTREHILQTSSVPRFQWQDRAVDHLTALSEKPQPTLIFNLAGTGAGKTRMNVKALTALRGESEPVRIAAGFNLRTLTLQTHHALQQQLGLGADELACVIGDQFVKHQYETGLEADDDEQPAVKYETYGEVAGWPDWLETLLLKYPQLGDLVGSPVLVSTMDYLVNAGEPGTQGHHAHALLRIASSDLILDEVDSYGSASVVAVLRVVQMAGMFGRNVIASSATLATPVADALCRAYFSGIQMHDALQGKPHGFRLSFIDDHLAPVSHALASADSANVLYMQRLKELMNCLQHVPVYRKPLFKAIAEPEDEQDAIDTFYSAILESVRVMHENNICATVAGKRISVGLIRVANVRTCVEVAKRLNAYPEFQVTAYHAVDVRLRRFRKEQALDRLLSRTPSDDEYVASQNLLDDPDIQQRIRQTAGSEVVFIVVATPIEEVGRDHDFDWAIVEPSSVQSIVQLSGRVNRHRLKPVVKANVTILQRNLKDLKGKKPVFCRPGNEQANAIYPEHNAMKLLGEDLERIDASLRFGQNGEQCRFAELDDDSIAQSLIAPMQVLCAHETTPLGWATRCHYRRYPLRDHQKKKRFLVYLNDRGVLLAKEWSGKGWIASQLEIEEKTGEQSFWLSPGCRQLLAETEDSASSGMTFEVMDIETAAIHFDERLGGY